MRIQVVEQFFEGYEKEVFAYFVEMYKLTYQEQRELVNLGKLTKGNFQILRGTPLTHDQGYGIDAIVHKDIEMKKAKLYGTIQKKMDEEIKEVNLYQGEDGTMNGTLKGETKTLRIETIRAGGYNVQCLHYRILVKVSG